MKGRVVNLRNEKYDVYIGRGSKWGNIFVIGKDGSREEVVRKYREWIMKNDSLLRCLGELKGKVLGCFCAPKLCHGDVLLELIEKEVSRMGMFEVYEDWFGSDGFYPHDNDSEDCKNWQEYSSKLGCIEVTVDDIRRAQAKEQAKYAKFVLPQSFKTARQQHIDDFCFRLFCKQFGIAKLVKRKRIIKLRKGRRLIRMVRFV